MVQKLPLFITSFSDKKRGCLILSVSQGMIGCKTILVHYQFQTNGFRIFNQRRWWGKKKPTPFFIYHFQTKEWVSLIFNLLGNFKRLVPKKQTLSLFMNYQLVLTNSLMINQGKRGEGVLQQYYYYYYYYYYFCSLQLWRRLPIMMIIEVLIEEECNAKPLYSSIFLL